MSPMLRLSGWCGALVQPFSACPAQANRTFSPSSVAGGGRCPSLGLTTYYTGFGPGNQYDLNLYPRTANTLRLKIRRANFLQYADYNAALFPPLPPKPKKTPTKPTPVPVPTPTPEPLPAAP